MKCPHCGKQITVPNILRHVKDNKILEAAGAIISKRRKKAGNQMTSEQARERQIKSVEARKANTERANDEE